MKVTYESLVKSSLRLISLGAALGIIAVLSLIFMNMFDIAQKYGIDRYTTVFILVSMFVVIVLINVTKVLSTSSNLNPNMFVDSVRTSMIVICLLLVVYNVIGIIADIPLQVAGIPTYIALYLLTLILFIISSILIKRRASGTEEKVLYTTGVVIDIVSVSMMLVILMYILGEIFRDFPFRILAFMSGSIALAIFIWIDVENMLSRIVGKTSTAVLWAIMLRRMAIAVTGIMLGSVVLYFDAKAIADMMGYRWSLASIDETFHLLLLISLVISFVAIVVGLVGGFLFIPSNHGVRGIPLLIRMSRGENIDLSVLGISVGVELPPQEYKSAEKPSEAPVTQVSAATQAQTATVEIKPSTSKCSFCGAEIPANAKFCPYCGAYLAIDEGTRLYTEPK